MDKDKDERFLEEEMDGDLSIEAGSPKPRRSRKTKAKSEGKNEGKIEDLSADSITASSRPAPKRSGGKRAPKTAEGELQLPEDLLEEDSRSEESLVFADLDDGEEDFRERNPQETLLLYEDDEVKLPEKKPSLWGRALEFLSRFKFRGNDQSNFENYSHFKKYLDDMDKKSDMYKIGTVVAELCDEALIIARQRVSLANKIQVIDESLIELECFNQLTAEDATRFKDLLDRFVSLTKEVTILRNQIVEFDSGLTKLESLEDQATSAMPNIQDAEKNFRALRHDLGYLRGEKSELEHDRELLMNGFNFVNKFSVAMVIIFSLSCVLMAYLYIFTKTSIFYPLTILVVVMIVVVSLSYFFRRRIRFELALNLKKQHKAIELINKKLVVLAHYRNFLDYEYKKYKVRSSKMLKENINDFKNYKHVAARLDNVRKIMYETEKQIEVFLREKKFGVIKSSIEKFAKTINIDDRKRYYNDLLEQKNAFENNLSEMDQRHGEIWDALVELNDKDHSPDKLIDKIIQAYLNEVTKIIGRF